MPDCNDKCSEHSGIKNGSRLLVSLLLILITLTGAQALMLLDVKTTLATFGYRFQVSERSVDDIKLEIREIKSRLGRLERFELGHKERPDG